VTAKLEADGKGAHAVNYRLRDWLISRQRYWGAPIPIVYCPSCGIVPVPEKDLPVLLPEDAEIPASGENALKFHQGFLHTTCPNCGGPAERETDTMDTFMCSSWYQYAYLSPYYKGDVPFDPKEAEYWLPVDQYTGGVEHATMHLIYTRFFTKAIRDLGIVNFDEPMLRLRSQGMILGADREKMSKSRGNVISPDEQVDRYGADTVRAYLMFGYRWEQGGPWDPQGIEGLSRFLYRVWDCVTGERERTPGAEPVSAADLRRTTHQSIRRATEDMEQFAFNTYVANLMELNNALLKARAAGLADSDAWNEGVRTLLLLLAPVCPHISEELWERIGEKYSIHQQAWPQWDPKIAREEMITLVIQVNGKVRDRVTVPADISEERAKKVALESEAAKRHIGDKKVANVVYAPGRLVNIVAK
jgi:leucyl-tRNA synthetase